MVHDQIFFMIPSKLVLLLWQTESVYLTVNKHFILLIFFAKGAKRVL